LIPRICNAFFLWNRPPAAVSYGSGSGTGRNRPESGSVASQASPAALPGSFGAGLGTPVANQLQLFNAQQQSTSAEELILNFLLSMNANDPRLSPGVPAAQTTQPVTQTTTQAGTPSLSSGSSGGNYGWLTSGMY